MDSATLQAPSGGKLGGSTDKKGPTTILCKTEKGSTKRAMFPVFVDTAVLFIHNNLGLCCLFAVKQSRLW